MPHAETTNTNSPTTSRLIERRTACRLLLPEWVLAGLGDELGCQFEELGACLSGKRRALLVVGLDIEAGHGFRLAKMGPLDRPPSRESESAVTNHLRAILC